MVNFLEFDIIYFLNLRNFLWSVVSANYSEMPSEHLKQGVIASEHL